VHNSMDLMDLLRLLTKKLWLILTLSFIGFLFAFSITKLVLKPMYTSSVEMYVSNTVELTQGDIDYNDISAAQQLVNTYARIIQSDRVLDEVISSENLLFTSKQIRDMMKVGSEDNTQIMVVEITTNSPQLSANLANSIAEISPRIINQITKTGMVEAINKAKANPIASSPDLRMNCLLGILLGLIASVLYIVLNDLLDVHVKGVDDIKNHYNIPILGTIPVINAQSKGGFNYYER